MRTRDGLMLLVLAIFFVAPMWAVEPTLLPHSNPTPGELAGFDVGRCDGLSAVGRPYDASAGSAAIYRGTTLVDEVFYPGAQINARFCHSLDITPDCRRLVCGAPDDDTDGTNAGACYVFDRIPGTDTYTYVASLSGADSGTGDELGQSAAISSDGVNIACGAHPHDRAYVWTQSGASWLEKKLIFSDSQSGDYAGYALAFSFNSWLIAAAPLDLNASFAADPTELRSFVNTIRKEGGEIPESIWEGSFYLFEKNRGGANNWGERFKGSVPGFNKQGMSVSASGRRVALGAPGDAGFAGDDASGDVLTILINPDLGGWTLEQHIAPPSPQANAEFGGTVNLLANQLTVGERWRDVGGTNNSGTWYVFLKASVQPWSLLTEIRPADSEENARNGWGANIYGGYFVGGAPFSDEDGADAGSAYIHVLENIFSDSFELGGTGLWSVTAPQ